MLRKMMIAGFMLLTAGCSLIESDDFTSEYVVEGYMFAGDSLPEIRLSRTVPAGTAYSFSEQAVPNALIRLDLLAADNSVQTSYAYSMQQRGVYSAGSAELVQPKRTYRLEVSFADDPTVIRSTTAIPDTFQILNASGDTVVFASSEQLEIDVTASFSPGRQNVFVFSTESFDPRIENFTPLLEEFFDEEEDEVEEFRINESPPINEGNYDRNPDGTLTIRLPWIAVNFYGPNRIRAYAIDDNVWDFMRSTAVQSQGSTLSPGEIPDVIDNIDNATGIFGSYARVEYDIFVKRNP